MTDPWKHGPYLSTLPNGLVDTPLIDTDHLLEVFTLLSFSYAVSSIWDWDIPLAPVRMSKRAALQAHRAMREARLTGEQHSLEALVYDGWEVPAHWFRAGTQERPHGWLGAIPVQTILDDSVSECGLAYLVPSTHPVDRPAYTRVLWIHEPDAPDPDASLLEAILADKASS